MPSSGSATKTSPSPSGASGRSPPRRGASRRGGAASDRRAERRPRSPRSTSLTKSNRPLVLPHRARRGGRRAAARPPRRAPRRRRSVASSSGAPGRVVGVVRGAAGRPRLGHGAVAIAADGASLRSRHGTDLQRHPAVGRAAHRQLPRRGEELGGAAAHDGVALLHRRLSRDHRRRTTPRSCARAARDGAVAARRGHRSRTRRRSSCSRDVPEHTELAWIFNTVTPLGELERQTQFKDKAQRQESVPAGLLNYPVLQAADILLYRADRVPVGEDQVQHLELSREIARRWNARFAPEADFFPEPQAAAHADAPHHGARRAGEDVEVAGQHHRPAGVDGGDLGEAAAGDDRSRRACARPTRGRRRCATSTTCTRRSARRRRWSMSPCSAARPAGGASTARRCCAESMEAELVPIRGRAAALRADPALVEDALAAGARAAPRDRARDDARGARRSMGLG